MRSGAASAAPGGPGGDSSAAELSTRSGSVVVLATLAGPMTAMKSRLRRPLPKLLPIGVVPSVLPVLSGIL